MTDKKPRKITDTSAPAQRARMLERLQVAGRVDTFEAREQLNIVHPGGRVLELRKMGYPIMTERQTITDSNGFKHSGVAVYYLSGAA